MDVTIAIAAFVLGGVFNAVVAFVVGELRARSDETRLVAREERASRIAATREAESRSRFEVMRVSDVQLAAIDRTFGLLAAASEGLPVPSFDFADLLHLVEGAVLDAERFNRMRDVVTRVQRGTRPEPAEVNDAVGLLMNLRVNVLHRRVGAAPDGSPLH